MKALFDQMNDEREQDRADLQLVIDGQLKDKQGKKLEKEGNSATSKPKPIATFDTHKANVLFIVPGAPASRWKCPSTNSPGMIQFGSKISRSIKGGISFRRFSISKQFSSSPYYITELELLLPIIQNPDISIS